MKQKLFIIVNEDRFFLSHRKEIAVGAKNAGYDVTVVAKDTGQADEVRALGVRYIELPVNPTGKNLWQEFKTYRFLLHLYRQEKPQIVHHVGLKTILWGGMAAKRAHVHGVLNAVSGLGVLFSKEGKPGLMQRGILRAFRSARKRKNVIDLFQNSDDRALFIDSGITQAENSRFIKGSGVDLDKFAHTPEPDGGKVKIIFTARMVKEKGIYELVEAAEILRAKYEDKVEFLLCGDLSNNPNGITREEMERLCDGRYVKWLGFCPNINQLLAESHIMAFPSYYREGVPKSLIDACAIGRPIVTTNSIGCRDVVTDGVNGYLVPPRDSQALAERLEQLIDDKPLRERMGREARLTAERDFSVKEVVKKHLAIYRELGG